MSATHHASETIRGDLGGLDRPLRELFERIAPHADLERPALPPIAQALVDLAGDLDYLTPRITAMGDVSGGIPLHVPPRGPRLFLVHRRTGQMGAIHDHHVWVALAPVVGVETHRRYRAFYPEDRARLQLVEQLGVEPLACTTLLPPDDIHAHGHLVGHGTAAYVLILLGDDQFTYHRHEWDAATGQRRDLPPGDRGRWLDSEPLPRA